MERASRPAVILLIQYWIFFIVQVFRDDRLPCQTFRGCFAFLDLPKHAFYHSAIFFSMALSGCFPCLGEITGLIQPFFGQ
jgi:hypothetical protein